MHRIELSYALAPEGGVRQDLHHPLLQLLDAVDRGGSINGAARRLGRSYRHVWGELKRWEAALGQPLMLWNQGRSGTLAPLAHRLLWAERQARARLAPQIEALRGELERAFASAFDDETEVVAMAASHDDALPLLRDWLASRRKLHLDIAFSGSVDALTALNQGRCLVAGFHALPDVPPSSPTAQAYRPLLRPARHRLIGFATRRQGLIVAAGNPLRIETLTDLIDRGLRFVERPAGTGTRIVVEELLAAAGHSVDALSRGGHVEPSHRAAAQSVANGSADATFGIEAAARGLGLDFIALATERYCLAILVENLEHPQVATLREALASEAWRETLTTLPGYAPYASGEVLALKTVLPWWGRRPPKR